MSTVEELTKRVSMLEETVSHLTTHHDEEFLMVHDDVTADTCDRLFNVNLREARQRERTRSTDDRQHRATHRKRRVVTTKRKAG
jgi:Rps23 Pro-64 3,4-dihydroxylase Tpa1-like proline 4-hydroxylase